MTHLQFKLDLYKVFLKDWMMKDFASARLATYETLPSYLYSIILHIVQNVYCMPNHNALFLLLQI